MTLAQIVDKLIREESLLSVCGPYRILVCGGRDFKDYPKLSRSLKTLDNLMFDNFGFCIAEIIEGGARGADTLAGQFADEYRIKRTTVKADWNKHGSAAGPIRNAEMLKLKPHIVVAFPGGRGTANMVQQARKAGVCVIEIV